jgi:predicted alpha/beta-fold hydrolase
MTRASSRYRAPAWLPGGHAQTIVAAKLVPRPAVHYRRERLEAPDGDFVDLDFALPEPERPDAPLVALFHGLEGSSDSHYALALMRAAADRGWRGVVIHFRGCSGEPNRLPRAYHSGDSDEADWVLRRLHAAWPAAPLHAVGVSLGGNVLAKWLGERAEDAGFVTAAASIGSPLDLAAGGAVISRGFNRLYTYMFLTSLKPKVEDKLRRFPGLLDAQRLRSVRTMYDFDELYTAPVHGYAGALDYWTRASGKPLLPGVRVPHLVLNALNDPFVPAWSLAQPGEVSRFVTLEQPEQGGHIGFPRGAPPGDIGFLPERVLDFFTRGQ